jgi:hypothetical protein
MLVYNVPKRKELKKNKKKTPLPWNEGPFLQKRKRTLIKKHFFYKLSDRRLVSHMIIPKNSLYYTE